MGGKDWNKNDNKTNKQTYKCSPSLSLFICFISFRFFVDKTFTMNVHGCRFGSSVCRFKEKTQQTRSERFITNAHAKHFCICLSCLVCGAQLLLFYSFLEFFCSSSEMQTCLFVTIFLSPSSCFVALK